jgi:organic radical activating enzyme
MQKIKKHHLEFYITNVCNLTCDHCRSFNNNKFKGLYEFDQEASDKWAQKLDLAHYSIIGGEPTLHPRLEEWMRGLRQAWPDAEAELITNGTHLSKVKNLHDLLADYRYYLQISIHGQSLRELIAREIFSAFGEVEIEYIRPNGLWLKTNKGVRIDLQNTEYLTEGLTWDEQNHDMKIYNSDPEIAHHNCNKACNHMIDFKMYKCCVVGLLPEFLRQQGKTADHLLTYDGITAETVTKEIIERLRFPIPHCSICPESPKSIRIDAVLKKHMIKKDTVR